MSEFNQLRAARRIAELEDILTGGGLTVDISQDFVDMQRMADATPDRAPLTPIFDWRFSDIGADRGFWLKVTDGDGKLVHMQGARFDDIGDETLDRHLARHAALYLSPHIPAVIDKSSFDECPHSRAISGRLCYHGEAWTTPRGPYRGTALVENATRLLFALCLMRWTPDFLWGLASETIVRKGIVLRYGYYHCHPRGVRWSIPRENQPLDEWLTWMTGGDLADLIIPAAPVPPGTASTR